MFKNFRRQIAIWFVALSSVVYLALSLAGGAYFYNSLSNAMDHELKVVGSQIGHAIDLSGTKPTFRDWLRVVETEPARSVMAMQLFDDSGKLLEHYGPTGIPKLLTNTREASAGSESYRIRISKLTHKGSIVGYLQLQLSTAKRAEFTKEFLLTMAYMGPFVLLGFGLCGYFVSGIAAKPIEILVSTLQRLVADAGHELNTPASIVQARAQSLERKLSKHGHYENDLKIIANSAERMGYIVKNLMVLAELDSIGNAINRKREHIKNKAKTGLQEQIANAVSEFSERFADKNIKIEVGTLEDAVAITDRESLQCILANLLENALKYTEPGGRVTISCQLSETEAQIKVSDSGIGIPAEDLSKIYDRFYRVDKSRSRSSGGVGLGLSIVKAIAERDGGAVAVNSILGEGSEFIVTLPIDKAAVVAQNLHTRF
ncbi:MAG: HAMP domain-containing sensor histidine kinase [Candidatus Melainabacteria bacterium]|nr:HAMP domain-containing sensor histidine kinase [Candidatus Melainabacteria bacterium]